MDNKTEIKPKIGLGPLLFGSTMQQVKQLLGEPEEVEQMDKGADFEAIVWHYWDEGFSIFFDINQDNLFTSVEIDNPITTLWGVEIFTLTEEEVKKLFKDRGFSDFEEEMHEWGEKRVSIDELLIDFYFEDEQMTSINFGAYIDKSEIIFWPN